jgi:hypothetical protein
MESRTPRKHLIPIKCPDAPKKQKCTQINTPPPPVPLATLLAMYNTNTEPDDMDIE